MKTFELPANTKAATGFTHKVIIEKGDFTSATNTQTLSLLAVPAGSVISNAAHKLVTPLVSSDGTLISAAYSLGNTASADSIMSSTEVLGAATEVVYKAMTVTAPVAIVAASQNVVAAFTATSAKALNTVTAGEIHVYLAVADLNDL
jgi:predicted dinucleotide-binding enzyme